MSKSQQKITRHTKKQGNTTYSKEQIKSPETDTNGIKTHELPGKESKITVIKMLNKGAEVVAQW